MQPEKTLQGSHQAVPRPSTEEIHPASIEIHDTVNDLKRHANDADEAMEALGTGQMIELSEAENKRLLRIIDWHLMPMMCVVYGLNFLDKTSLSYASVMGLKKDLNLVGDDYQWLSSMFYFGYLAWEYPTSRLLQRLPLAKYSAFCVIMWGVLLALFSVVHNFSGAVAIRFFLGVFESAVTPGFALLTSQWYTTSEQGSRTATWFSFNGFGSIFGGLVSYGIAHGSRIHGAAIAPWKIVFLVNGCLTACLGIVFFFVVPDNQLNARWLSPQDRILAVERVRVNRQGIGNKHFKFYQLKEAFMDPISWAIFFYALVANIPNGGISNFFSQLVSRLATVLPTCPTGYKKHGRIQLTVSTPGRVFWLHRRTVSAIRFPRRRRPNRCPPDIGLFGRQAQESDPRIHGRPDTGHPRHAPHSNSAAVSQVRSTSRVLPDTSGIKCICCRPQPDQLQCCGIHQEDHRRSNILDRLLCW